MSAQTELITALSAAIEDVRAEANIAAGRRLPGLARELDATARRIDAARTALVTTTSDARAALTDAIARTDTARLLRQ